MSINKLNENMELHPAIINLLKDTYDRSRNDLIGWRKRYPQKEYPQKVVLNIFYRQHAVNFMWSDLIKTFNPEIIAFGNFAFKDPSDALSHIIETYRYTQITVVFPILLELIKKDTYVGMINYQKMLPLINCASNGDNKSVEEIEYSYIYYDIANMLTYCWFAHGMTGKSKDEALSLSLGVSLDITIDNKMHAEIESYNNAIDVLGKFGGSNFLNKFYNPLPSLF